MKGTVWYLADIVVAITSLFMVMFMLFIAAVVVFVTNVKIETDVIGTILYSDSMVDNAMLAYMDSTEGGRTMAELLAYAAVAGNESFTLQGKDYDMAAISDPLMKSMLDRPYRLTLILDTGQKVILAQYGRVLNETAVRSQAPIIAGGTVAMLDLEVSKL